MILKKYNKKRNFSLTSEPKGIIKKTTKYKKPLRFVVQKHDASHLHFDFRLEMKGVMKSWAVPKGPSLDPNIKRLAVEVEDHPISYNTFEGEIPKGEYGGGRVIVWDNGTYNSLKTKDANLSEKEFIAGHKNGMIHFELNGKKLKGIFTLVKFKNNEKQWMLIKKNDEYASKKNLLKDNTSVLSENKLISKKEIKKPERIKPMLATLVEEPFNDKNWIYEIKWDGYRALANIHNGKVDLYSRNFISYNDKFPKIVAKLKDITESVILDGEIIAYDEKGNVSFQELQNLERTERIEYVIFDILNLEGNDLSSMPQIERKKILKEFLKKYPKIKESDYIENDGKKFFKLAIKQDLEGIMAKDKNGIYISNRRTKYWLKIKNHNTEEVIIAGFTEPRGGRKYFGALVLGINKRNKFKFVGHTGTGFDEKTLNDLYKRMLPLVTKTSPFKEKIPINSPITWLKPKLIAQVKFAEWTKDGVLRQAVYQGLRSDKNIDEVKKENKIPIDEKENDSELKLTNLDKIYFSKLKITKGNVISYYKSISEYILPYLKDRPESLNRHPNGIAKPAFFQKNITGKVPSFVKTSKIFSESNNKNVNYLICQNQETLSYMNNLGCIEINPWNSRLDNLDYPDYLVFDLDPRGSTWINLIKVTKNLKRLLDKLKVKSYIKTSGKAGLHVYIPLQAEYEFEDVRNFSHLISEIINKELPTITSLERNPEKRRNKIYLDYLQNRIGQTTASVYSLRPTDEATISTPLKWSEVNDKLDPKKFNINTIEARIKKVGDIWKPLLKEGIELKKILKNLENYLK